MNPRRFLYYVAAGLVPYIGTEELLIIPEKQTLALMLALLSVLIFAHMGEGRMSVPLKLKRFSARRLFLVLYALCIFLLVLLPWRVSNLVFVPWNQVSPIDWVRVIASFLMGCFLPGYALQTLVLNGKFKLPIVASLIISYLASALIGGLIGYAMIILGVAFGSPQSLWFMLSPNLFLLSLYLIRNPHKSSSGLETDTGVSISIDLGVTSILLVSVAIIWYAVIISNLSNTPMLSGDQWTWNGIVSQLLSGILPIAPAKIFPSFSYPLFFVVFLGYVFQMTALPPANSYALLNVFDPITVLSIYIIARSFTTGRKLPAIAAVFSMFAGLGWVLVLTAPSFIVSTYDWFVYPVYLIYWWAIPIGLFAIPSIAGAVYIARQGGLPTGGKVTLLAIAIVVGYLMHELEIVIVVGALSILLLMTKDYLAIGIKEFSASLCSAIATVVILDALSPVKSYIFVSKFDSLSLPLVLMVATTATLALFGSHLKRGGNWLVSKLGSLAQPDRKTIPIIVLWVYLFSATVWLLSYTTMPGLINLATFKVPWFTWPIRLGVPGLLALGVVFTTKRLGRHAPYVYFFFALFLVSISGGFLVRLFPSISFTENLFSETAWLAVISLGGLLFVELLFPAIEREKLLASLVVGLIVFAGVGSTLYGVQQEMSSGSLSTSDINALTFLKNHVNSSDSVVTLASSSATELSAFANVLSLTRTVPSAIAPLLDTTSAGAALRVLAVSNVKYVYIDEPSRSILDAGGQDKSYFGWSLNWLPIAFQDNSTTIYTVPEIAYPTQNSTTALVYPAGNSSDASFRLLTLAMALSGKSFTTLPSNDLVDLDKVQNLVLPEDPLEPESVHILTDTSSTEGWASNAGVLTALYVTQSSPLENGTGIVAQFNAAGGPEDLARIQYTIPSFQDMAQSGFLVVNFKTQNSAVVDLNIMDTSGNWRRWLEPVTGGQWVQFMVNLNNFTQESPKPIDLGKINRIIIGLYNTTAQSEFQVGPIGTLGTISTQFVESATYLNSLVNFVRGGGNITILNQGQNGYFRSLATRSSTIYSAVTLAPGLSFNISETRIGLGCVRVLSISQPLSSLPLQSTQSGVSFLRGMGSLLEGGAGGFMAEVPSFPPYWGTAESALATGHVSISASYARPLTALIDASTVDLADASVQGSTFPSQLTNSSVAINTIGGVANSTIVSNYMELVNSGPGDYSTVLVHDFVWRFDVTPYSLLQLESMIQGSNLKANITAGIVTISAPEARLEIGRFSVSVSGTTVLNNANLAWPPFDIESSGGNVTARGISEFTTISTDGVILFQRINVQSSEVTVADLPSNWKVEDVPLVVIFNAGLVASVAVVLAVGAANIVAVRSNTRERRAQTCRNVGS